MRVGRRPGQEARDGVREPRHHRTARLARVPRDDELRRAREQALGAPGGRRGADRQARRGGRHHVLRHRRRLQRRPERGRDGADPPEAPHPRGAGHRHQGVHADDARRERPRPVAQARDGLDRRLARAARAGLRRPVPDPPLGSDDADRGDDGRAPRRREGGQGALHRGEQHVRLAVREGAGDGRATGRDAVRLHAEPREPRLPRGGAGDDPALHRPGRGGAPVEPARARPARRQPDARGRAPHDAGGDRPVRRLPLHTRRSTSTSSTGSPRSPRSRASRVPRSRSRGCSPARA